MKNLLDLLHEANAIEIDGTFCRYFTLELEECENDNDIALSVEFECDYNIHEHYFTVKELREATYEGGGWLVNNCACGTTVTPYKLNEIKA